MPPPPRRGGERRDGRQLRDGVKIRANVEIVVANLLDACEMIWHTGKPSRDRKRLMHMRRRDGHGFCPEITIADGIRETMAWYRHKAVAAAEQRYNAFTEAALRPGAAG